MHEVHIGEKIDTEKKCCERKFSSDEVQIECTVATAQKNVLTFHRPTKKKVCLLNFGMRIFFPAQSQNGNASMDAVFMFR